MPIDAIVFTTISFGIAGTTLIADKPKLSAGDTKAKTGFEISIGYSFLEFAGLFEGKKQIAEFLHEIFLVDPRDVYDLELAEAAEVYLGIYGDINVLDFYGLDYAAETVLNTVASFIELSCKSAINIYFSEKDKPIPKYLANSECFGCLENEVWCILMNASLCMEKVKCIENLIKLPKFANDTDLVRISILVESDTTDFVIDEILKVAIKQQLAEQIMCPSNILTRVDIVHLEQLHYEIGLQINNQNNLTELEEFTMKLYKLTDIGILKFVTQSAILTSVQESFLYQQRIYGYTKEAEKQTASSVGT
ncbi:uncharacterized protein LOC132730248 [Ruditapes philippinarum]|uniref:uncharacterized protein LOC132730248 n=1 Tax=Ruditapes philippinarum TaxID=129788 RepID=UPI00295B19E9|nr:uncharacterized protein LOC132730248 [Ruditapes philippinarum]